MAFRSQTERSNAQRGSAPRHFKSQRLIITTYGGARGVKVIVVGNGHGDTSSNPDCISNSTNTPGKGMNPIILPPAMRK